MKKLLLFLMVMMFFTSLVLANPADILYFDNKEQGYSESPDPWTTSASASAGAFNDDCHMIAGIPGLGNWSQRAQWNLII